MRARPGSFRNKQHFAHTFEKVRLRARRSGYAQNAAFAKSFPGAPGLRLCRASGAAGPGSARGAPRKVARPAAGRAVSVRPAPRLSRLLAAWRPAAPARRTRPAAGRTLRARPGRVCRSAARGCLCRCGPRGYRPGWARPLRAGPLPHRLAALAVDAVPALGQGRPAASARLRRAVVRRRASRARLWLCRALRGPCGPPARPLRGLALWGAPRPRQRLPRVPRPLSGDEEAADLGSSASSPERRQSRGPSSGGDPVAKKAAKRPPPAPRVLLRIGSA